MENKRNSGRVLLNSLLSCILIFVLGGTGVVGYFGYQYYKNNYTNSGITADQGQTNTDFSSNQVYTPAGSTVDLVKRIAPSVVTVITKTQSSSPNAIDGLIEQGLGTGFFVSSDGLLITNEHVVCEDIATPNLVSIVTSENKTYSVQKIAADPSQDIAILKVDLKGDKVTPLKFANEASLLAPGQDVIAIGNPLGVNPGSITRGIISGLNRNVQAQGECRGDTVVKEYEGVIQTDAAINSGNSGGPLINLDGEVVAVNSATSSNANNISYAVPFERVVRLLNRYQANNGNLTLPFFGVQYRMVDQNRSAATGAPVGAYVELIVKDGPSEKAGIRVRDIITKIGDKPVDFSLQATLNQHFEPNQKVKVEIFRPSPSLFGDDGKISGQTVNVDMTIGQRQ